MGDMLNWNISDLGLTEVEVNQAAESSANEGWQTRLLDGAVYLARIEEVSDKISDNNIGYNVSLLVMTDSQADAFDANASTESMKYNYLWAGRNGGTKEEPEYEQPVDSKGKSYVPPQLLQFIGAVGPSLIHGGKVDFKAGEGAVIKIKVKHEEYQGNVNAKVDRWLKAEGVVNVAASAKPVAPEPLL